MILDNLLFCSVLGTVLMNLGVQIFVCHGHTTLTETNIANPIVPYHVKEGKQRDGANFLKALNEKPEYMSTCCHRLLFRKTVRNFLINEYDYTNEIVQKSLAN